MIGRFSQQIQVFSQESRCHRPPIWEKNNLYYHFLTRTYPGPANVCLLGSFDELELRSSYIFSYAVLLIWVQKYLALNKSDDKFVLKGIIIWGKILHPFQNRSKLILNRGNTRRPTCVWSTNREHSLGYISENRAGTERKSGIKIFN